MRVVLLFIFSVLTIDIVILSIYYHYLSALMLLPMFLAFYALTKLNKKKEVSFVDGWQLSQGIEITNPVKPEKINQVVLQKQALELGMTLIGSPKAGKSSACIGFLKYISVENDHGCAYLEGKGDVDLYKQAKNAGVEFDYFFSSLLKDSHSINLLEGSQEACIEKCIKLLIGETSSTSYYSDAQRSVLLKIIPLLLATGYKINLKDLYAALAIENAGLELMAIAREKGVSTEIIRQASSFYDQDYEKRKQSIEGMLNRLIVFVTGRYAERINAYEPDISLYDVVRKKKRVYFHLPYSELSKDIGIAISETFKDIATSRQMECNDKHELYPIIYDDWSGMFYDEFGKMSARVRSAGMPISFSFQSTAHLKEVSQQFMDSLDDTQAVKILLRLMGEDSADFAVRLFGQYDGLQLNTSVLGDKRGISINNRDNADRISRRDLKNLNAGEAFISTLEYSKTGEAESRFYKTVFPLPFNDDWVNESLPEITMRSTGSGLGLYERHVEQKGVAIKDIDEEMFEHA